ncbi:MAG: NINE protein [Candidatus Heimdallarchaeaceae archaeon]
MAKYFCANCGSIIEEGIKFCANCGTSVSERQPPQQPAAQPTQPYTPAQPYAAAAPTYTPTQPGVPVGVSPLSRTVALLLCIFMGGIGVHKFYVGKVGTGIAYLLFSWTGIPAFIAFIEIFIIANGTFRDDKGLPLVTW